MRLYNYFKYNYKSKNKIEEPVYQRFIKEPGMVKTHPMWNNYPHIQSLLQECLELIIEKITIENKDIEKTVTDLIE